MHPLQEEIQEYIDEHGINYGSLGKLIGIHENSARHFFRIRSHNQLDIIQWYLGRRGQLAASKKRILKAEIENIAITCLKGENILDQVEDLKRYIDSL